MYIVLHDTEKDGGGGVGVVVMVGGGRGLFVSEFVFFLTKNRDVEGKTKEKLFYLCPVLKVVFCDSFAKGCKNPHRLQ